MKQFLVITKALADATRVRALLALRELCLCQIIELLDLAPSTVSKHMDLLYQAGLVERRKQGRWLYFRLGGRQVPATAQKAMRWTMDALADDATVKADATQLGDIRRKDLKEVSACYRVN